MDELKGKVPDIIPDILAICTCNTCCAWHRVESKILNSDDDATTRPKEAVRICADTGTGTYTVNLPQAPTPAPSAWSLHDVGAPAPTVAFSLCDSQHHTADSNKARSVRHDAAGHMGKLGRRTPPQDGLMEAASLWRGGDSHRSGPVVLPTQQISDLKRSGKQETQPATTAQCFSSGNDRGSTKHSSVPPWHDDERTCSPRAPQGLRSAGGAAARSLELFAAILRGVNGGLNATPVPTGAPRPTGSTRAACL